MMANGKSVNRRWWTERGDELHRCAMANYRILKDRYQGKPDRYLNFMSLYMNRNITSDTPGAYMDGVRRSGDSDYERVKFNLVKLIVDTVHNRIAKMKPRARVIPTGGNASLSRRGKLLERWLDAIAEQSSLYRMAPLMFQDACIFGMGVAKPYRVGNKFYIERVYPGEIFVDPVEAAYDNVRQLFHRKYLAREVVEYQFVDLPLEQGLISSHEASKRRKAIKSAMRTEADDDFGGHTLVSDPLEVVEAWHLASGPGAKDGKHIITIDGAVLVDEDYEREKFPLCFIRWSHEPRGFYGIGLTEELQGIHVDINKTLNRIEESLALNASPYIFNERSSQVKKSHITNIPGTILDFTKVAPQVVAINALPPEFLTYLNNQVDRAFRIAKLNNFASGSQMPAALQTGAAVREYNDTDRQDFAVVMDEYQDFFMQIQKEFIRLGKEAYEEDSKFTIVANKDKYTISRVKWKDVDMDEDVFALRVYPASALPVSPSGRIDKVIEMMNAGLISPDRARVLIDIPDLEREQDMANAASDNIDRMIEEILDEGKPQVLEPFVDPQLALKKAQTAYDKAVSDEVPEDRLTLLRMFMLQASESMQLQQQQALANQVGLAQPSSPPALDGSGQNPLAITGNE